MNLPFIPFIRMISGLLVAVFATALFTTTSFADEAKPGASTVGSNTAAAVAKTFPSPEVAVEALVSAIRDKDPKQLQEIFGSAGKKLFRFDDTESDIQARDSFVNGYAQSHRIVYEGDNRAELEVGNNQWPLPIPLVKQGDAWRFDAIKGRQEMVYRRIGKNELAAIQVCMAIVDAEREYASVDRDGDGLRGYADKFISSPGKHDGLYWQTEPGAPQSPLGPLLAAAARDGHKASDIPLQDYHGYYYRILTSQGNAAPGGAYDYRVKGKLFGGFAVVAYPARYGSSGIMSFMVNHDGVVYQKDLGKKTALIATKLEMFNPDASWKKQE